MSPRVAGLRKGVGTRTRHRFPSGHRRDRWCRNERASSMCVLCLCQPLLRKPLLAHVPLFGWASAAIDPGHERHQSDEHRASNGGPGCAHDAAFQCLSSRRRSDGSVVDDSHRLDATPGPHRTTVIDVLPECARTSSSQARSRTPERGTREQRPVPQQPSDWRGTSGWQTGREQRS